MESSEDTWANDSAAGVQLQLFRERFAQQRDSKRRSSLWGRLRSVLPRNRSRSVLEAMAEVAENSKATTSELVVEDELSLAKERLKKAGSMTVAFAVRTFVAYNGSKDEDCPLPGCAVTFKANDYLHITEKFNDDWWIGRVVEEGSSFGFIPSAKRLESRTGSWGSLPRGKALKEELSGPHSDPLSSPRNLSNQSNFEVPSGLLSPHTVPTRRRMSLMATFKKPEPPKIYESVPLTRPILLIGPSLKGLEITDSMQKPLLDCIKKTFKNRLKVVSLNARRAILFKPGIPVIRTTSSSIQADVKEKATEVFDAAKSLDLVLLESNISFPSELAKTSLAPLIVCIRITSQKVLKKLIKSRGKSQTKRLSEQLLAAEKLAEINPSAFDLLLEETKLGEVRDKLVAFLEQYWRAVHPLKSSPRRSRGSGVKGQPRPYRRSFTVLSGIRTSERGIVGRTEEKVTVNLDATVRRPGIRVRPPSESFEEAMKRRSSGSGGNDALPSPFEAYDSAKLSPEVLLCQPRMERTRLNSA